MSKIPTTRDDAKTTRHYFYNLKFSLKLSKFLIKEDVIKGFMANISIKIHECNYTLDDI